MLVFQYVEVTLPLKNPAKQAVISVFAGFHRASTGAEKQHMALAFSGDLQGVASGHGGGWVNVKRIWRCHKLQNVQTE
jgi:hypothetical protein